MEFNVEDWDNLAWKIAYRHAAGMDDPSHGAEDIHGAIVLRWLEKEKSLNNYDCGETLRKVLVTIANGVAVASKRSANSVYTAPMWTVEEIRDALPQLLRAGPESWTGTLGDAARKAWEALSGPDKALLAEGRPENGMPASVSAAYYRAVERYARQLNRACEQGDRREHEGPGARRAISNAHAVATVRRQYES